MGRAAMLTRRRTHHGWLLGTCTTLAVLWGCGAAEAQPKTAGHDEPVPAGEPRADLTLELDLPPSQACEEQFDLALYEDRRIDQMNLM